jgi:surface polysaccharide O-acyltransferase-like enzyme
MNAFHPVIGESGLCGQSVVQNLIRLVIGVSGSLALITSFSYDDSTHPWMSKIGQNTLGLYVLNITFSDMQRHILPLDWTNEWPALGLALILTMIEIPLFLGIIRLIKKHKYATLFFLGRE